MKTFCGVLTAILLFVTVLNFDLPAQDRDQLRTKDRDKVRLKNNEQDRLRSIFQNMELTRSGINISKGFVDLNGDGINDNAVDSDGDGIPNGQDPDYKKPLDGSGRKIMNGPAIRHRTGIGGFGPGDGTSTGVRPMDGTGYGPGTGTGTGDCDGTGPKGRGGRR